MAGSGDGEGAAAGPRGFRSRATTAAAPAHDTSAAPARRFHAPVRSIEALVVHATAAFGFVAVAAVAVRQGGYFPPAWGWISVSLLWIAGLALLLRRSIRMGRRELVFLAALAGLALWIVLSAWWSVSRPQSLLEAERTLVYLAAAAAVLLAVRRRSVTPFLGGILAAVVVVSAYSLATRLFPERLGVYDPVAVYRLSEPVGYWNALGIFSAIGLLLALGFAAHGRTVAARAAAAAGLCVLAPTVYFTFGRGPWLALGLGLASVLAVSPRRLKLALTLVVIGPAPAVAVVVASRSEGLTHQGASLAEAGADGRRLAVVVLVLAALAGGAAAGLALAERRIEVGPLARRSFAAALVILAIAGAGAVFDRFGGPQSIAERGYREFTAPPPQVVDLSERLLNLSGNGRAELWQLGWENFRASGWLGSGAGTYENYYFANRPPGFGKVRDAHGLYVEVLSELGPVGLGLLLVALAGPLAAGVVARNRRLVPAALGAYVAFLAHAAVDWDWEVPAVTMTALLCGSALLVAARGTRVRALAGPVRICAAAAVGGLGIVASLGLVGHAAVERSAAARESGRHAEAEREARNALRLLRWSPAPWAALGEARLRRGDRAGARAAFEEAVAIDPANWRLWVRLALASEDEGRERALGRAAELNPHGAEITTVRRMLPDPSAQDADG